MLKGSFHAVTSALFTVMAIYNLAAWYWRTDSDKDRNLYLSWLYSGGAAFESRQAARHFRR